MKNQNVTLFYNCVWGTNNDISIILSCVVLITTCEHANRVNYRCAWYYKSQHVSMLAWAFSSKYRCAGVKPRRTARVIKKSVTTHHGPCSMKKMKFKWSKTVNRYSTVLPNCIVGNISALWTIIDLTHHFYLKISGSSQVNGLVLHKPLTVI